jgi:hypothetical protein
MSKLALTTLLFLICFNAYAYPVTPVSGTVEKIIDRSIYINNEKFIPSGYAPFLPKWVTLGAEVTISFSCNELGDCYYIDVVESNSSLPLMDKINQELLELKRVFP